MNWLIGMCGGCALYMLWFLITQVACKMGVEAETCWIVFAIGGTLTWLSWNIYWVEIRK